MEFQLASPITRDKVEALSDRYVAEIKLDGIRVALERTEDRVTITSRGNKDLSEKFPHLLVTGWRLPPGTILDGELCLEAGSNIVHTTFGTVQLPQIDFSKTSGIANSLPERSRELQMQHGWLTMFAFDVITFKDYGVMHWPEHERRQMLEDILHDYGGAPYIQTLPRVSVKDALEYFDVVTGSGGEGIMLKDTDAVYKPGGRTGVWYKLKKTWTTEVVVMGFTEGTGKYEGLIGAVKFGQYQTRVIEDAIGEGPFIGQELVERGQCSGMTDEVRRMITDNKEQAMGCVMEIEHHGHASNTPGFRYPQFKCWRWDKKPQECIWDD